MPALILFNRRWQLGGDDLVFPAIGSVCVRIIFLACAIAVYVKLRLHVEDCVDQHLLAAFLIGLIAILSVTIVLESTIGVVSARGTVTNARPRSLLPALLYVRGLVFLAEIAGSVVGAVWIVQEFDGSHTCDATLVNLVRASIICCWVLLIAVFTCVAILFGGKPGSDDESVDAYDRWEKRCKIFCFCERKDENSHVAYADAAAVFASIFQNLDIVLSDIVAGLILVQVEQERRHRQQLPNSAPNKLPGPDIALPTESVESHIETIVHFYQYSMASNGWPILVNSDLMCWSCKLCCSGPYYKCGQASEHIQGDNCCQCNTTAIRAMAGADEDDLLYVSFQNRIFQSPFFVVLDHERKSVVVAIRGTLSFKDALTDVSAEAERLDVVDHEIFGHRGCVNNSRNILCKLKELRLLDNAFERHPDYNLVVTGHSLGAGVAAILSILLKTEYPTLKTYAFSPPGGLINAEGVEFTQDFVTSVVLGEDIIPRTSISTLQQLRDQLVTQVRACPLPKYRILMRGVWYTCRGLPDELPENHGVADLEDEPLLSGRGSREGLLPASPTHGDGQGKMYQDGNRRSSDSDVPCINVTMEGPETDQPGSSGNGCRGGARKEFMDLYPPGQMIWVRKREMHSGGCCGRKEEYTAQWVTHRQFDHIGVKPGMVQDHLPMDIDRALSWLDNRVKNEQVVHPGQLDAL